MIRRTVALSLMVVLIGNWPVKGQSQGKIVFESDIEGVSQIFSINVDGSELTNLSNDNGPDSMPVCSPDGQRVAFSSRRGVYADIYVMDVDGSNVVNITREEDANQFPSWSPDGTQIAYWKVPTNTDIDTVEGADIYISNADGSNGRWLPNTWGGTMSSWSPSGDRIAYQGGQGGQTDIFVIDLGGGSKINLTNAPVGALANTTPAWSPSGDRIAFTGVRNRRNEIFLIDPDGANLVNLTNTDMVNEFSPTWSPDGTQVAFVIRIEARRHDLYLMNADGTNQTPTIENFGEIYLPSWCSGEQLTLIKEWSWGLIKARAGKGRP